MIFRSTLIRSVFALLACACLVACSSPPPAAPADAPAAESPAAEPLREQALLEDLVLANRILTREVGILDIQAHVSARSKDTPGHWYMARFVSPGGATLSDMDENDLESTRVAGPRDDNGRETYLPG